MIRSAALAISALCLLGACNQNNAQAPGSESSASNAAPSGGATMPTSGVPYRADMTMTAGGRTSPAVMYRSGANSRTEMDTPAGHTIMIMNGDTHTGYSIITVMGRTIANRIDISSSNTPTDWNPSDVASATRVGPCSAAGENGTEYTRTVDTPQGSGSWGGCITSDGIMLRTTVNGQTVMEATRIQRGPQDAALFQLPPGVEAHDLGNAGDAMRDAIAAAQAKGH